LRSRTEATLAELAEVDREQNVKVERLPDNLGFGLKDIAKVVRQANFTGHLDIKNRKA